MNDSKAMPLDQSGDEKVENVPAFKRKRVVIPLLVAVAIVSVGAYFWSLNAFRFISTNDAMVETDRITVSSKILGRVAELRVGDGDTVHPGDTLFILDDADLKVQEKKITSTVALQASNADVAHENLVRAQQEVARAEKQLSRSVIPQDQYDHTVQALNLAQAQYKVANAQIESAKSEYEIIKAQLNNTVVCGAECGVVAKHWVQKGDVVSPGQAVYTVFNHKNQWVTGWFEETKLRFIKIGQPVQIQVDAYPEYLYKGAIEKVGESTAAQFSVMPPSNASGNFTKITQRVAVKIRLQEIPETAPKLIPGLSVTVKVRTH
jgi:membrane fusion protein (multidrug efflux system)